MDMVIASTPMACTMKVSGRTIKEREMEIVTILMVLFIQGVG